MLSVSLSSSFHMLEVRPAASVCLVTPLSNHRADSDWSPLEVVVNYDVVKCIVAQDLCTFVAAACGMRCTACLHVCSKLR